MKISFDAATAKVHFDMTERDLVVQIANLLSYTDRNTFYANKRLPSHLQRNPKVCLFDHSSRSFPTGLLYRVIDFLGGKNVQVTLDNRIPYVKPITTALPDSAWEHQVQIVQAALNYRRGIIKSPTGSGKTRAAAYIISQFPKSPCIFTVPTKDLLHQSAKALESTLGEKIGKVGDDIQDWQRITVGIINSLSNQAEKNPKRFEGVEVLVIDECHRAGSEYYVTVGNSCINSDVRIAFSATPWRSSGDDLVMEGVIGQIILSIPETVMVDLGVVTPINYYYLEYPDPQIKFTDAVKNLRVDGTVYYTYNNLEGRPEQAEVYDLALVNNYERNQLIVQVAVSFLESKYEFPGVILVERIEHGKTLQEMLAKAGYPNVPFVSGQSKKRQETFDQLGKGLPLMIASSILKEGVDIPQLGVCILAGGGSSSAKIIQQVGRICRKYAGKSKAIIIDICDQEKYYLATAADKRITAIEKTYPKSTKLILPEDLPKIFN